MVNVTIINLSSFVDFPGILVEQVIVISIDVELESIIIN